MSMNHCFDFQRVSVRLSFITCTKCIHIFNRDCTKEIELATHNISILYVPAIIAYSPPSSIVKDLHTALRVIPTTNQPNETFFIT